MKEKVKFGEVDYIHAHTLFSDGVLAYKAHKEYGVKYAVAIRNTDLNNYIRLMKHTYSMGRKILLNAKKVYFISAGIKKQFEESKFVRPILDQVKDKFVLQPNGIDDYWHQHISHEERTGHDVLYVGDFSANKNVVRLAEAVLELRKEKGFEDVRLIIVGGEVKGGARKNDGKTQAMIDANPEAEIIYFCMGGIYEDTGERSNRGDNYTNLVMDYRTAKIDEMQLRLNYSSPCAKMVRHALVDRHNIRYDEVLASNDTYFSMLTGYYATKVDSDPTEVYIATVSRGITHKKT